MSDPRHDEQYEAPAIDEREPIDTPLVAVASGGLPVSAAFHPADDDYEAPAIVEREEIDTPLVALVGSGGTCLATH